MFISKYHKCFVFLILSSVFSSTNSCTKRAEQVLPGSRGKVDQTMYIHVSQCKNNTIKKVKNLPQVNGKQTKLSYSIGKSRQYPGQAKVM
jgi:hypothetical protein